VKIVKENASDYTAVEISTPVGEEKWPSKAFQAAFLNENIDLIKKYFA
jgi:hypothetical protein